MHCLEDMKKTGGGAGEGGGQLDERENMTREPSVVLKAMTG